MLHLFFVIFKVFYDSFYERQFRTKGDLLLRKVSSKHFSLTSLNWMNSRIYIVWFACATNLINAVRIPNLVSVKNQAKITIFYCFNGD